MRISPAISAVFFLLVVITLLGFPLVSSSQAPEKRQQVEYSRSPLVFLSKLAEPSEEGELTGCVKLQSAPQGWITIGDAIELFRFANNKTKCSTAINVLGSIGTDKHSTIGIEARRMVLGYILGAYPPVALSPPEECKLRDLLLDKVRKDIDQNINSPTRLDEIIRTLGRIQSPEKRVRDHERSGDEKLR